MGAGTLLYWGGGGLVGPVPLGLRCAGSPTPRFALAVGVSCRDGTWGGAPVLQASGSSSPGPAAVAHHRWGSSGSPDTSCWAAFEAHFPRLAPSVYSGAVCFILPVCWVLGGLGRGVCKSQLLPVSAALCGAAPCRGPLRAARPLGLPQSGSAAAPAPCPGRRESCGDEVRPSPRSEELLCGKVFLAMNSSVKFV